MRDPESARFHGTYITRKDDGTEVFLRHGERQKRLRRLCKLGSVLRQDSVGRGNKAVAILGMASKVGIPFIHDNYL